MMVESVLEKWESQMEEAGGVALAWVDEDLKGFSAEVISKACFGRKCVIGNEVFSKTLVLQDLLSKHHAFCWSSRGKACSYKTAHDIRRIQKEVDRSVPEADRQ